MKKVSSQFEKGMDGEVAAWTWLGSVLKLTGLTDTMQEWELQKEDFNSVKDRYIFTRK